jgi:dTDP-4-dehydrorhamnose reductase
MKVLILGSKGMLGTACIKAFQEAGHEVVAGRHDITHSGTLYALEKQHRPHVVLNCAGVVPEKADGAVPVRAVLVNAVGSHNVAQWFRNSHVVHVSTDCVFSGAKPGGDSYGNADRPDPTDTYGRSKLAGELYYDHCTTVRTSFIGPEHGLMRWFLGRKGGVVQGWRNAFWTGSTVDAVARGLVTIANLRPGGGLVQHLSTVYVTRKLDVLNALQEAFGVDVRIVPSDTPHINRSLHPTVVLDDFYTALKALQK